MHKLTDLIDRITMYRLTLYMLAVIVASALVGAVLGKLGFSVLSVASSFGVVVLTAWISQLALVRIFSATANVDSWLITAGILALALKPAHTQADYAVLVVATIIAMASKFVVTFKDQHFLNPAAFGLVVAGLLGSREVYWWVGNAFMLPVVLIAGFVLIRKTRRFTVTLICVAMALAVQIITKDAAIQTSELVRSLIVSGPLIFFVSFLLTEPQTAPKHHRLQLFYAAIVGTLYGFRFAVPPLYASPEFALLVGNVFTLITAPTRVTHLLYEGRVQLAAHLYELQFSSRRLLGFQPGQYAEWTLAHTGSDSRGVRRFFTFASAPTEQLIKVLVRIDPTKKTSSFKQKLLTLTPGRDHVHITGPQGDFTLPHDTKHPVVFIAGGVGISPFRSMVEYMDELLEYRQVTLFYTADESTEFAYWKTFSQAEKLGVTPHYFLTGQNIPESWKFKTGFIQPKDIQQLEKYKESFYYISGPLGMVKGYRRMLRKLGIKHRNIKTDYFAGY